MNDRNKMATTDEEHIPLAQASLLVQASLLHVDSLVITEVHTDNSNERQEVGSSSQSDDSLNNIAELTAQDPDIPRTINLQVPDRHQNQPENDRQWLNANSIQSSNVDPSKTCGAWAAGTILGFIFGGPTLSMAFGVGAAYYSQQREGVAADVARVMGEVAILSQEKFVEVNEKHNLVGTIASSTSTLSQKCFKFVRKPVERFFFSVKTRNTRNPFDSTHTSTDSLKTTSQCS
mmetsp:Transcript_6974/g.20201  ORF Transcript_6974/g.20201 Transcript_6974/m.20201 type:complete len:233 (-) Transcript_6974:3400-4098(-)